MSIQQSYYSFSNLFFKTFLIFSVMQASSERTITAEDRDEFRQMAKDALDEVCIFASVCQVNRSPEGIRKDLEKWWASDGCDLLVVEKVLVEEEEGQGD